MTPSVLSRADGDMFVRRAAEPTRMRTIRPALTMHMPRDAYVHASSAACVDARRDTSFAARVEWSLRVVWKPLPNFEAAGMVGTS